METFSLKDVAGQVATAMDLPKKQVLEVLQNTTQNIVNSVKAGNKLQLSGLGTFERKERAARNGVNPSTGEKIKIAAKFVPKFKAAKAFKLAVL